MKTHTTNRSDEALGCRFVLGGVVLEGRPSALAQRASATAKPKKKLALRGAFFLPPFALVTKKDCANLIARVLRKCLGSVLEVGVPRSKIRDGE